MRVSEAKWRVNRQPRFTTLTLGDYMVAEDGPRETMLRDMRYEKLAPTLIYRRLHQAIPKFLTSPTRDRGILDACREDLENDRAKATTPTARDNCTYAIRALDTFEASLNALPITGWTLERAPLVPPLKINGVSVSVQPTARIRVRRPRGVDQIGSLLVHVAKGVDPKTDDAKAKATGAMLFAAMLLHQEVSEAFPGSDPKASAEHCIVLHTYRRQVECCPSNYRRPLRNMTAVCGNIRRGWSGIEPPPDFDPKFAVHR